MTATAPSPRRPRPPSSQRMLAIALLVPLALFVVAFWLNSEYQRQDEARVETRASNARRAANNDLLSQMRAAESAQRGYVLTGDPVFLAPYPAIERATLARLDRFVADFEDPAEARRASELGSLVRAKFAVMDKVIALRRTAGFDAALAVVRAGTGRQLMARIDIVSQAISVAESRRYNDRRNAFTQRTQSTQRVVWIVVVLASLALAIGMWLVSRSQRARHASDLAAFNAAQRNRTILDSTVDAILILNPSGTVETVNAAATRLLGYSAGELARRDLGVLVDLKTGDGSFSRRIGLVDGQLRQSLFTDCVATARDGRRVPVDVALGLMDLAEGQFVVASIRDVSARKQVERLKDDLISTVSHELRTPLTSIVGALGLLRTAGRGVPPEALRLVEIADNNARRLIRLINDMLDIDRIDAGKFQIKRVPLDLRDIARQAATDSEGLASTAGVTILPELPEDAVPVEGDGERLLQVIGNLLSNAVRVTPRGATIRIGVVADPVRRTARLSVDDEGPGVPAAFRDRIFGRFERAERNDGNTGTGLGLAISREIVTRHDGRIWFEDRTEGGTRFAFELPTLATAAPAEVAPDKSTILICEDDADAAAMLREMVEAEGHATYWVPNAAEARKAIRAQRFAALLLDLKLPDEDGLTLAASLYANARGDAPPIIVVSGTKRNGRPVPVPVELVDWVEKPVSPDRLLIAVKQAIGQSLAARPTILHVDDDVDTLEVTASAFGDEARVLKARDLATARALLREHRPDAAILDLHLSDGSGLDLLPALVDEQGMAIPSILYSAHEVGGELADGVDAVLIKSRGSLPDLRATLRRVLRGGHHPRAGA